MLDLCIRNGSVLNGTGSPAVRTDVGVKDGRIVAMGDLSDVPAGREIDAASKTVCPGFLDMHRHADAAIFRGGYLTSMKDDIVLLYHTMQRRWRNENLILPPEETVRPEEPKEEAHEKDGPPADPPAE